MENGMMTILVVGATGATGRLLVRELLQRGHTVRAIVRSPEKLTGFPGGDPEQLDLLQASLLDLSDEEMVRQVEGCDAVASCLGHNLSWKGVYGPPRRLVTDAARRLCEAIRASAPAQPVKYVLMNSAGVRNRDLDEPATAGERIATGLLRLLLPPHVDNEQAADYLRTRVGRDDPHIEWVAVRPDGLIDEERVTDYHIHPSPTRSALFAPGKTSRINVAHFMADLITDPALWNRWAGQMPVLYNTDIEKA
jgi:nucleoside-diphosphate-sugar epimerase